MLRTKNILALIAIILGVSCGGATPTSDSHTTQPPVVLPTPGISLGGGSVFATAVSGSSAITQSIDILPLTAAALTSLAATATDVSTSASPWLTYSLTGTTAPAKLQVTVDPATVSAGTYTGTVRLTANGAEPVSVSVRLVVDARPKLTVSSPTVAVNASFGDGPSTQLVNVASTGGVISGLSLSQPKCDASLAPWLTASLSSTTTPTTITLTTAPGNNLALTYHCTVTISSTQLLIDGAPLDVAVNLDVKNASRIALSHDTVFVTAAKGLNSRPAGIAITNGGSPTASLGTLSVGAPTYGPGASGWLTYSLDRTTVPAVLSLTASAIPLAEGTYRATVPIASNSTAAANSPTLLPVVFTVTSPNPQLAASPSYFFVSRKYGTYATYSTDIDITSVTGVPIKNLTTRFFPTDISAVNLQTFFGCPNVNSAPSSPFTTPCVLQIVASPPPSTPIGTYSYTVLVESANPSLTAYVTVNVTITP